MSLRSRFLRPLVARGGRRLGLTRGFRRHTTFSRYVAYPLCGRTVELDGFRMRLDRADSLGLGLNFDYEPDVRGVIERCLRPGDSFVDVGANIGWFALVASGLVGPSGLVLALEPELSNFELLASNAALNRRSNIYPLRLAASDAPGTAHLEIDPANAGAHRFADRGETITAARLADVVAGLAIQPRLVKIDVEGAEERVLDGMGDLLEEAAVILEFAPDALAANGSDPGELLERLGAHGEVAHVMGGKWLPAPDVASIMERLGGYHYAQVLCRPRSFED